MIPWKPIGRNRLLVAALLVALAGLLAACGPLPGTATPGATEPDGNGGQEAADLAGTAWILTSLRGQPPLEGTQITLEFQEEHLGGVAGCNSYGSASDSGGYRASDGELQIPTLTSTLMACEGPAGVMDQEATYLDTLPQATAYRLEGDVLELQDTSGKTILTFRREGAPGGADENGEQTATDLAGTAWILSSLRGQPPIEDTHLTLEFMENGAAGFAGCNSFGSARDAQVESEYVASGGELVLPPLAQTLILCSEPEGVMEQEDAYMEALRQATAYRLEGDVLELQDEAGETILTFQRQEELSMDPGALPGTAWRLVSLDGEPPADGSTLTLAFHDEHQAGGHAGCRDYVVGYRAGEDGLSFYYTAMMGEGCLAPGAEGDQDRMLRQEGIFADALSWTDRFRLAEDGSSLELLSQRGESLVFEALPAAELPAVEGTTWVLVSFVEPNDQAGLEQPLPAPLDAVAGTEVALEFRDGTAAGSAGCNQYTAPYSLEGAALNIEDPVSTKMFCEPEGVMEQEQRLLSWLAEAETAQVHGGQLWLVLGDGRALVFTAEPGE